MSLHRERSRVSVIGSGKHLVIDIYIPLLIIPASFTDVIIIIIIEDLFI